MKYLQLFVLTANTVIVSVKVMIVWPDNLDGMIKVNGSIATA